MTHKIIIRPARLKDIPELIRLEQIYVREHNKFETKQFTIIDFKERKLAKNFEKKIKKKNKLFLVLEGKKQLEGYLFAELTTNKIEQYGYVTSKEPVLYLENVYISKLCRGQGFFGELMKRLKSFAREKNITYIELHVASKNPAKNIYSYLGFKSVVEKMRLRV